MQKALDRQVIWANLAVLGYLPLIYLLYYNGLEAILTVRLISVRTSYN